MSYKLLLPPPLHTPNTHTQHQSSDSFNVPLIWRLCWLRRKKETTYSDGSRSREGEGESGIGEALYIPVFFLPVFSLFSEYFLFLYKPSAFCWLCMSPLSASVERPLCFSSKTFQNKSLLLVINFMYLCAWEYLKWLSVAKMQWQTVYIVWQVESIYSLLLSLLCLFIWQYVRVLTSNVIHLQLGLAR